VQCEVKETVEHRAYNTALQNQKHSDEVNCFMCSKNKAMTAEGDRGVARGINTGQ